MGSKMNLDKISQLCDNLYLDDDDGLVLTMDWSIYKKGMENLDFCLKGKILGNKVANRDGMEKVLKLIWRIPGSFQVEQIRSNNMSMFHFSSIIDKNQILVSSPCSFECELISLVQQNRIGEVVNMEFNKVAF